MSNSRVVKSGQFFMVYDGDAFILEDKTKRNLTVLEVSMDERYGVEADKGIIYDADGRGHRVSIRWYFPKERFRLEDVLAVANALDEFYRRLREETCPD
ncbi:MAG: hypothetical protein NZ888_06985 [Candidatus Nitrosocaldus sp.]|nr:hypothetical protein [Candidatus Nitrosocaldus sp.]MDW8000870.1 hypothetical protein [Candidatus Nitrosocaldus sp.]